MFQFNAEEKVWAKWLMSQIYIPSEFGFTGDYDFSFIEDQIYKIVGHDVFFEVSCGISKEVIIFDSLHFVIKIPYNGRFVGENEERYFMPYAMASEDEGYEWDYCYDECKRIDRIREGGFGCFMPHTEYLCTVCDRDIYIQEKVIPLSDDCCAHSYIDSDISVNPSNESMVTARNYIEFNTTWAAVVIDLYGEDYLKEFIDYLSKYSCSTLRDMHEGNYGFDFNGVPVIFDVSGYRDE